MRNVGYYIVVMLTLITPTTQRPKQFALCEKYMARQTVRWDQWIVCGEDHTGYSFTLGQEVITRDASSDPPDMPSLCLNYLEMVPRIKGDMILPIEDDDWYSCDYLEKMVQGLSRADLAGFMPAFYWHVCSRKHRDMKNTDHASLAATGFTSKVLDCFCQCAQIPCPFIDMKLWVHWPHGLGGSKTYLYNDHTGPSQVGIKGLPYGLYGCGLGHDPTPGIRDARCKQLRYWIGDDFLNYYSADMRVRV